MSSYPTNSIEELLDEEDEQMIREGSSFKVCQDRLVWESFLRTGSQNRPFMQTSSDQNVEVQSS